MAKKKRDVKDVFLEILGSNLTETRKYPKFRLPAVAPSSPKTDMAQYLLTHNFKTPKIKSQIITDLEGSRHEDPSVLTQIFDTISAPLYAVTNTIEDINNDPENQGKDWWEKTIDFGDVGKNAAGAVARVVSGSTFGLAEKIPGIKQADEFLESYAAKENKPMLFNELLKEAGVDNPVLRYGLGFGADVALDPLTYVPVVGWGRAASKAKKIVESAPGGSPEAFTKAVAPEISERGITQGAGSNPPGIIPLPEKRFELPGIPREPGPNPRTQAGAKEIEYNILNDPESLAQMRDPSRFIDTTAMQRAAAADRMRDINMAKKGKIYEGKQVPGKPKQYQGNISIRSATEFVEAIERGEILRFPKRPPVATGALRDTTIRVMDDFITSHLLPKSGRTRIDFNPANQAQLYNKLYNSTEEIIRNTPEIARGLVKDGKLNLKSKEARKIRRYLARTMLRTAEDHAISLRKHPVYWNGMRVRLSDVLEDVGMIANDELATKVLKAYVERDLRKISVPEVGNAIHLALARRSYNLSDVLENASSYAKTIKGDIFNSYITPKAWQKLKELPEEFAKISDEIGLTPMEMNAVKDIVRNVINVDALPTETATFMEHLGSAMMDAAKAGRISVDEWDWFNRKIIEAVGMTKEKLAKDITGNTVVDTIMTRWTTWYGRGEMKKYSQDVFTYGERNAELRAELFNNMARQFTPEEIEKAFIAASDINTLEIIADNPRIIQLANQMREYFESMLSSTGMKNLVDQNYTPAVLSRTVMDDVNRHLKAQGSTFEFVSKREMHKITGVPRDYTEKGVGWMASWERADPKKVGQNPMHLMFDIDQALEKTTKEYALIDDFAMRFGRQGKDATHTAQIVHNRMPDGIYFEPQVAKDFRRLLNDLDDLYIPQSKIMRYYARGLRVWKTGVTIYLPSHHIRNMIGDLHLMWWAGHNDPMNFIKARRVLQTQRRYLNNALQQDTFKMLNDYTAKDALEWAKTSGSDIMIKKNGVQLTADEIYIAAHQHGLLMSANRLEDIFGEAPLNINASSKLWDSKLIGRPVADWVQSPLGGKAHHVAAGVAEYREHYVRMSHFIGAVTKGIKQSKGKPDLAQIFDDAAHEVRKWHPDGRDLTKFEQKVRMAIPFYSWTRKATPLIVQALAQRPAKVLYYPRANQMMQGFMGIETDNEGGYTDVFPDDQLFPEWIRAKGMGPIGDPESSNMLSRWFGHLGRNMFGLQGQEKGYTMVDPSNPFQDVVESLTGFSGSPMDIGRSIFDQTSPVVKVPGELFISKEKFSGAPIEKDKGGEGILPYLAEQVPIVSPIQNVAELGKEERPGKEGKRDWQAFINYLTAAGIRGTGPYQKSAEFEARERIKAKRKQER